MRGRAAGATRPSSGVDRVRVRPPARPGCAPATRPSAGCCVESSAAAGSAPGAPTRVVVAKRRVRVGARWTPTLRAAAPRLRESRTTSWTTGYRCSPVAGAREALSTTITGGAGRSLPSRVSVRASSAGRSRVAMTTLTAPASACPVIRPRARVTARRHRQARYPVAAGSRPPRAPRPEPAPAPKAALDRRGSSSCDADGRCPDTPAVPTVIHPPNRGPRPSPSPADTCC